MDQVIINGMMIVHILENGNKIKLVDLVLTLGLMEDNIRAHGWIIIWKE